MKELVKVSSFGKKDKILSIDQEIIRFQDQAIRIMEITEIKYAISVIQFYRFSLGNRYQIGFKTPSQQVNIILKSYFGLQNDYFADLCNRIIAEIWEPVTDSILQANMDLLLAGGTMQVGNCQVSKEGIFITQSHAITRQQQFISWEDLYYEEKYDRLVLNSKSDYHIWTNLYFQDTWNIDILIAILDWVTKENGLAELQH